MFFKKKKEKDFYFNAPLKGKLIALSDVNDQAFASGMLGKGFAIEPLEGMLYMPFDGEVIMIFPSKHAIGLKDCFNNEYLIHIGIDTVELNGDGFEIFVKKGSKCKVGERLISFSLDLVKEKGYEATVMIVKTNHVSSESFEITETKQVEVNEPLIQIRK